jgi:hypothetical protein
MPNEDAQDGVELAPDAQENEKRGETVRERARNLLGYIPRPVLPSPENAVYASTAGLLFGGLVLLAVGVAWVVYASLGTPSAVAAAGATMTAYGVLLVLVLSRAGYLGE